MVNNHISAHHISWSAHHKGFFHINIVTSPPIGGGRGIVMPMSVCLFVCLFVCVFVCPCFRKISKCNISAISQPIIMKLGIHITYVNAKYKSCRYYIPLHFDTNPESLRPFVPEIWPNNVFNLSATYDLDLWPKILKIFFSHGVPIRNMYAKFHNDRLRNGWDIRLWNCAKTRTNTQTNRHGHYNTSPSPYGGRGNHLHEVHAIN